MKQLKRNLYIEVGNKTLKETESIVKRIKELLEKISKSNFTFIPIRDGVPSIEFDGEDLYINNINDIENILIDVEVK